MRAVVVAAWLLGGCVLWPDAEVLDGGRDLGVYDFSASCPEDEPASCPSPAPTYAGDGGTSAIFASRCVPCHSPGGIASDKRLDSYASVFSRRATVLDQVYNCIMPPADAGALSAPERAELLNWLVCDSPP